MAHGGDQARRAHDFAGERARAQKMVERRLDLRADGGEPRREIVFQRVLRHDLLLASADKRCLRSIAAPRAQRQGWRAAWRPARLASPHAIADHGAGPGERKASRVSRIIRIVLKVALLVLLVIAALIVLWRFVPPVSTPMLARWALLRPVDRQWVPLSRISTNLQAAVIMGGGRPLLPSPGRRLGRAAHGHGR